MNEEQDWLPAFYMESTMIGDGSVIQSWAIAAVWEVSARHGSRWSMPIAFAQNTPVCSGFAQRTARPCSPTCFFTRWRTKSEPQKRGSTASSACSGEAHDRTNSSNYGQILRLRIGRHPGLHCLGAVYDYGGLFCAYSCPIRQFFRQIKSVVICCYRRPIWWSVVDLFYAALAYSWAQNGPDAHAYAIVFERWRDPSCLCIERWTGASPWLVLEFTGQPQGASAGGAFDI